MQVVFATAIAPANGAPALGHGHEDFVKPRFRTQQPSGAAVLERLPAVAILMQARAGAPAAAGRRRVVEVIEIIRWVELTII